MRRILFVDDEQQILDGLRDGLRKQRHAWDMVFCAGGLSALEAMQENTFDVIVADMRMPGMDGAELLAHVKLRSPGTVRIVLSGQADRELVMKMLPVSQQFLSKPCSIETLRGVIERACTLRDVLQDPAIQNLVGNVDALPAAPSTYLKLSDALASLRTGIADVAAIVEADPALSAKLLQIVNSAYFGYSSPVSSVAAAVNYLGLDLIKALSLLVGILSDSQVESVPGFSVSDVQQEALLVAHVARCIVVDATRRDEAFTVGVLHDIGKLILATRAPQHCATVLRMIRESARPTYDIELEVFGTTHANLGAFLLGTWGLPFGIVQGVAYHHAPGALHGADDPVTIAVHIADALVRARLGGHALADAECDRELIARLGFEGAMEEWWEITTGIVDRVAAAV